MPRSADAIDDAIETFVRGFCVSKSRTHPYLAERVGSLWAMRDAPRKNPRDYRKEEWIARGVEPREVDAVARRHTRGRFFICSVFGNDEADEPLRAEYKRLGYRLLGSEPLFVHRLARVPRGDSPAKIQQVRTAAMAERYGRATRSRPIPAAELTGDSFRQYVAIEARSIVAGRRQEDAMGEIVGWVRSITAGDSTWCSDMYVRETHRRRGIGRALLAKMLRDDRARGSKQSVLLSSKTGALVYPTVGYEQIGTLLIWAPQRRP
jgi:GNAT superfamily N-acetyltransferase